MFTGSRRTLTFDPGQTTKTVTVTVSGDLIDEADATLKKHRGLFFRIGTGEITDSLALEPWLGLAPALINFLAGQEGAVEILVAIEAANDLADRHRLNPAIDRAADVEFLFDIVIGEQGRALTGERIPNTVEKSFEKRSLKI